MIVVDASAVVEFLLGGPRGRAVEGLLVSEEGRIQAPAILDAEVMQALRRLNAAGIVREPRGRAASEILQELPVKRHPTTPLIPRLWELRENITAYDAAYVALAEALSCPLITLDSRLAQAPGHVAEVIIPQ